jgi:hypothetical protein
MKKIFITVMSFCLIAINSFAQEDTKTTGTPVTDVFNSCINIDNQTTEVLSKKSKQIYIQHRFTDKIDKYDNLYGIFGSSNIRLGFAYGITNDLTVSFATEKNLKLQDFSAKYALLRQSGSMPVSVTADATFTIDGRSTSLFGAGYKYIDRFSYFAQLLASRKINDRISVEVGGSFMHFNKVEPASNNIQPGHSNNNLGIMAAGKAKFYKEIAFIAEYSQSFRMETYDIQEAPKPVVAGGIEITTGTHVFQIVVSNASHLNSQYNYVYSHTKLADLMFGFNITVKL